MATLDWQLDHAGDATLVELFVTSDADTRVEIESALQPVWPPRQRNRPAAGWTESGFEGVVTAGEELVLGYASPADPVEPPATIVATEPVEEGTGGAGEQSGGPPTPEQLVRSLGEAAPPRDAVPAGTSTADESEKLRQTVSHGHTASFPASSDAPSNPPESDGHSQPGDRASTGPPHSGRQSSTEGSHPSKQPADGTRDSDSRGPVEQAPGEAVEAWLDAVERRLETAERLAAVETAEEARAAVDAAGGIEAVRELCRRLDADRARIERIEAGTAGFGQRLGEVNIPLSALERLA